MRTRRSTREEGPVARKRLIADIPEPIFRALKVRAAQIDEQMRDLVAEALRRYLNVKGGGEVEKK